MQNSWDFYILIIMCRSKVRVELLPWSWKEFGVLNKDLSAGWMLANMALEPETWNMPKHGMHFFFSPLNSKHIFCLGACEKMRLELNTLGISSDSHVSFPSWSSRTQTDWMTSALSDSHRAASTSSVSLWGSGRHENDRLTHSILRPANRVAFNFRQPSIETSHRTRLF